MLLNHLTNGMTYVQEETSRKPRKILQSCMLSVENTPHSRNSIKVTTFKIADAGSGTTVYCCLFWDRFSYVFSGKLIGAEVMCFVSGAKLATCTTLAPQACQSTTAALTMSSEETFTLTSSRQ